MSDPNLDVFTTTMNRFCSGLASKIMYLAEQGDDDGVQFLIGGMLDAIRETMANLLLLELECERLIHRGHG